MGGGGGLSFCLTWVPSTAEPVTVPHSLGIVWLTNYSLLKTIFRNIIQQFKKLKEKLWHLETLNYLSIGKQTQVFSITASFCTGIVQNTVSNNSRRDKKNTCNYHDLCRKKCKNRHSSTLIDFLIMVLIQLALNKRTPHTYLKPLSCQQNLFLVLLNYEDTIWDNLMRSFKKLIIYFKTFIWNALNSCRIFAWIFQN